MLLYYKLPREQGENVLVGEIPLDRDSEVALLIEKDDMHFPRFLIERMGDEVHVERADSDEELYYYAEGGNFDAVLPFPHEEAAWAFLQTFDKTNRELDRMIDG